MLTVVPPAIDPNAGIKCPTDSGGRAGRLARACTEGLPDGFIFSPAHCFNHSFARHATDWLELAEALGRPLEAICRGLVWNCFASALLPATSADHAAPVTKVILI